MPRLASSYRAARRNEFKAICKDGRADRKSRSLVGLWEVSGLRNGPTVKYRPAPAPKSKYVPHIGAKQRSLTARAS